MTGEEPVIEVDQDDEQEEAPTRPSGSHLMEAMGVGRLHFARFEEGEEDAFCHIHALENKAISFAFGLHGLFSAVNISSDFKQPNHAVLFMDFVHSNSVQFELFACPAKFELMSFYYTRI